MRLEWQRTPYSSENGNAGGIPLFGISWRTQRDRPDWSMHTQFPAWLARHGNTTTKTHSRNAPNGYLTSGWPA